VMKLTDRLPPLAVCTRSNLLLIAILLCTCEVLLALPFTSDALSLDYGTQFKIHAPSKSLLHSACNLIALESSVRHEVFISRQWIKPLKPIV
jgi:hypothetical protein